MKKVFLLEQVSAIDAAQWNALTSSSSVASFFQTKECYDFFCSLSFVEAFGLGVQEDGILKGVIVGYIQKDGGRLKQFFSRRAIINGGPLLADDISEQALRVLLSGCYTQLKKKAIYVESRNFNDYSRWKTVFAENNFQYEPHYDFQIDTSTKEIIETNLGKSRKRDVRTSFREGVAAGEASSFSEVKELYSILQELYRTKVKTPLFPLEFFQRLFESDFAKTIVVRYGEKVIGGTVCVVLEKRTMYEWFACGEDGRYKNIFPSTVATYSGICCAAEQGCSCFDMMGAGRPGDGGYGVRDFKAKFGGKLVEHGRFRCVCSKPLFALGSLGVKIMKRK